MRGTNIDALPFDAEKEADLPEDAKEAIDRRVPNESWKDISAASTVFLTTPTNQHTYTHTQQTHTHARTHAHTHKHTRARTHMSKQKV